MATIPGPALEIAGTSRSSRHPTGHHSTEASAINNEFSKTSVISVSADGIPVPRGKGEKSSQYSDGTWDCGLFWQPGAKRRGIAGDHPRNRLQRDVAKDRSVKGQIPRRS